MSFILRGDFMPRPQKCRRICGYPRTHTFLPENAPKTDHDSVVMTVVEYETIRLMDYENLTQVECAARMEIARTTVTSIYESARKKVANALVNGKKLEISGGNYVICEFRDICCGKCGTNCNVCKNPCKK